jgi:hypothetical protein
MGIVSVLNCAHKAVVKIRNGGTVELLVLPPVRIQFLLRFAPRFAIRVVSVRMASYVRMMAIVLPLTNAHH